MGPSSVIKPEIINTSYYSEYNGEPSYQNTVSGTAKTEDLTIKSESHGYHQYMNPNINVNSNNLALPNSQKSSFRQTRVPKSLAKKECAIKGSTVCSPKKQGLDDNSFSIQQWRQWKGKFSAKDSNGFHCLVCSGKSYSTERALLRHYKQVHELICAQCRICFSEEHLLKQHRKENHEFWCFPCSKVYTTSRALRRHNQQQHGISQSSSVSTSQLEHSQSNNSSDGTENFVVSLSCTWKIQTNR